MKQIKDFIIDMFGVFILVLIGLAIATMISEIGLIPIIKIVGVFVLLLIVAFYSEWR